MRISKVLALAGIGSRRKCEVYVQNGAVCVNGEVVRDLGRRVDPARDTIQFRGRMLDWSAPVYFMLHKPEGYITSAQDPHHTRTVYDLLPRQLVRACQQAEARRTRVFPVGRLDRDTTGLLLFTNDGALANRLTHPRYQIEKCYEVRLHRPFERTDRGLILKGIRLREGLAKVKRIHPVSRRVLRVFLCEGKKREVRRIFAKMDYKVVGLKRTAFGSLRLGGLPPGAGRFLTEPEVRGLRGILEQG